MESKQFQLNKQDLLKISKGALYALSGALLTYISATIPHINFGEWTPLITAIWSIIVLAVHRWSKVN